MPRIVEPKEVYAQPEPSDQLVWAICDHTFHAKRERCERCAATFEDPHYGEMVSGCRAQGEEIARVAMAVLRREGWRSPDDAAKEIAELDEIAHTAMRILGAEDQGAMLVQCVKEINALKREIFRQAAFMPEAETCTTNGENGGEPSPEEDGPQTPGG